MDEMKQKIKSILEEMGYKPKIDDDGDVYLKYQMKTFYFMPSADVDDYLTVWCPQRRAVAAGEEAQFMAICNKCTREVRMAKFYVDANLTTVGASCEFFFNNDESLKYSIQQSLDILGRARTVFLQTQAALYE